MATSKIKNSEKVIYSGSFEIPNVTTTETDLYIAFPNPYISVPTVVISFTSGSYNRRIHIKAISAYGFTVTGALLTSGTASVYGAWISVGK